MHRTVASALAALFALALLPTPAGAAAPAIEFDKDPYARELTLRFSGIEDPAGTVTVSASCDDLLHESDPPRGYANPLTVPLDLPGCEGYGTFGVWITVRDGTSTLAQRWLQVGIAPRLTIERPLPAITGHPFTFEFRYPDDYTLPAGTLCRYEFRWGNDRSLLQNEFDETFGALGFDADAVGGTCPAWTFTLPWVPYRQYELHLDVGTVEDDGATSWWGGGHVRFPASVSGTGRLIAASNLPLAQVLPSTYAPVVGEPVTYTRHLVGGATAGSSSDWNAWQGADPDLNHWYQRGGSTFTITPWETGHVLVGWQRGGSRLFYAMYDPPVRRRDTARPDTTPPVQRIGAGTLGSAVPVTLAWDGSDRGWGIDRFQLERRVDGGAWTRLVNARRRTFSQPLLPGHRYQYRVRAVDRAGNIGDWDLGPAFRPAVLGDGSSAVRYRGPWEVVADDTARGGSLHRADPAGASATYTFRGRDVAWVAARGPGQGRATVYVDGAVAGTVDLAAAVDTPRRIVFRRHWRVVGDHRVRIVVQGTPGRPAVGVDAFIVLR